jgi:hypothetical protein
VVRSPNIILEGGARCGECHIDRLDCTALFTRLYLNEQLLSTGAFTIDACIEQTARRWINAHGLTSFAPIRNVRNASLCASSRVYDMSSNNVHLHTTHDVLVVSVDELNILLDLYQTRTLPPP